MVIEMFTIGSHVSFSNSQLLGATEEAISYQANTFMFYTGAPTNTLRIPLDKELIKKAQELMLANNIDINNVICHAPYIVNPASSDEAKQNFAINFLKQELNRCNELGVRYLVLHPGSSVGITKEEGLTNIAKVLNNVLNNDNNVMILLETMAGKGSECGTNTSELQAIINNVKYQDKLGVCLDTCHLNDAGIDIANFDDYLADFDSKIGVNKIHCVHINDSKNSINSHKDRHANIGIGTIGFANLIKVIYNPRLKDIPFILETPYIGDTDDDSKRLYPPYKFEIAMIRNKTYDPEFLNNIRKYYKKVV
jgi:deoxyribonuclease IV